MYAIVEITGQQFKVEKDQQLFVHRLEEKEGNKVTFDNVLLIDNKGKVNVGAPVIKGASVSAKVIEHLKGDKVIVFKKKRRKGYKVKNGHRQFFTKIQIESIAEKGTKVSTSAKDVEAKPDTKIASKPEAKATKTVEKKAPVRKTSTKKTEAKTDAPKKTVAKKPAANKTTAKKTTTKKKEDNK